MPNSNSSETPSLPFHHFGRLKWTHAQKVFKIRTADCPCKPFPLRSSLDHCSTILGRRSHTHSGWPATQHRSIVLCEIERGSDLQILAPSLAEFKGLPGLLYTLRKNTLRWGFFLFNTFLPMIFHLPSIRVWCDGDHIHLWC